MCLFEFVALSSCGLIYGVPVLKAPASEIEHTFILLHFYEQSTVHWPCLVFFLGRSFGNTALNLGSEILRTGLH